MMSAEKFGRYKAEVEEMIERKVILARRSKLKSEKHPRDIRGIKGHLQRHCESCQNHKFKRTDRKLNVRSQPHTWTSR